MAKERTEIVAVFMDTNILYDYSSPEQIKWIEDVFPMAAIVRLIIPPILPRELNAHKDSNAKPMRRERAGLY